MPVIAKRRSRFVPQRLSDIASEIGLDADLPLPVPMSLATVAARPAAAIAARTVYRRLLSPNVFTKVGKQTYERLPRAFETYQEAKWHAEKGWRVVKSGLDWYLERPVAKR